MVLTDHTLEELFPELIKEGDHTVLFSGGARGADTHFGKEAAKAGFKVIHWCFRNDSRLHKVSVGKNLLELSDPHIEKAAVSLCKAVPENAYVKTLIQRSAFQVCFVDSVYAVGWPDDRKDSKSLLEIDGGTGWSCQMYVDRFDDGSSDQCKLYFFDQKLLRWSAWDVSKSCWKHLPGGPPHPTGRCAGIGSRRLTPNGESAIRSLFVYNKKKRSHSDSSIDRGCEHEKKKLSTE